MPLVFALGCESSGNDDDGFFGIGGSGEKSNTDDIISSDRDLDRNTGNTDAVDGLGEPGDREMRNQEDKWLGDGSGGIGGVNDTGGGTGKP